MKFAHKDKKLLRKPWLGLGSLVVGVDEVGRGCLAGPVVSCALILKDESLDDVLFDSKILRAETREQIQTELRDKAIYCIGVASVEEIDQINILQATFLSMRRALRDLNQKVSLKDSLILVDGNHKIPKIPIENQRPVVQGDSVYAPISAASIVAKVYRDQLMKELDLFYPHYQFGAHKGYGTQVHREAISKWGPTLVHRRTFGGVKEYLGMQSQESAGNSCAESKEISTKASVSV